MYFQLYKTVQIHTVKLSKQRTFYYTVNTLHSSAWRTHSEKQAINIHLPQAVICTHTKILQFYSITTETPA